MQPGLPRFDRLLPATLFALLATGGFANKVEQIFRDPPPIPGNVNLVAMTPIDQARWIAANGPAPRHRKVNVEYYTCDFDRQGDEPLEIDISADERFWLFLDGRLLARGPHRGTPARWFYQSYRIDLDPGRHNLKVIVTQMGEAAPLAQLSSGRARLILKASGSYDPLLTTGRGVWKCGLLSTMEACGPGGGSWGGGHQVQITGTSFLDALPEKLYTPSIVATPIPKRHACGVRKERDLRLWPTDIPDQLAARRRVGISGDKGFDELLSKDALLVIPAHSKRQFVIDLGNYFCFYPQLHVGGGKGAKIAWGWTESLVLPDGQSDKVAGQKGRRNQREGKIVPGLFQDTFLPDGRQDASFTTPWWRCGRWSVLTVETADDPVTLKRLVLEETRYPADAENAFEASDSQLAQINRICNRAMEMCSHEMFFDCPFIEQQMYGGDSRVDWLVSAAMTPDARLVRRAIGLFDDSRFRDGFLPMNTPSRRLQESGTYSICLPMAVGDYALWRDDLPGLRKMLPGMRHTLAAIEQYENAEGILEYLPGWCFLDWGHIQGKTPRLTAPITLHWALALLRAADAEAAAGNLDFAAGLRKHSARCVQGVMRRFWNETRGLIADDPGGQVFTEHAQALGILVGAFDTNQLPRVVSALEANATREGGGLVRTGIYFSHYLFSAYKAVGRPDLFLKRLGIWREAVAYGFATTPEEGWLGTRSDCHAWSAHPAFHFQTLLCGIRPTGYGFSSVEIAPQPGPLKWIRSTFPHPKGKLVCDLHFEGTKLSGRVVVPDGLPAVLRWNGLVRNLSAGVNEINL